MAIGKTFAAILVAGAVLGTVSAKSIPTDTGFRGERPWHAANPEDYPEIVAVTYDAVSGPYFAPKAYSAVSPVIPHAADARIDEYARLDEHDVDAPFSQTHEPAMEIHDDETGTSSDEADDDQMIVEDY